jgi:E3 ubiquitin-protein ligase SH3RF
MILIFLKKINFFPLLSRSDLSFKKGDIIILRKRIDQNWFHGELNGKSGFLPASYVQVLVAPPSPLPPQCKVF